MTESSPPPSVETLLEHRGWLRAVARSLVADENLVDDLEQRTWLTVLRNRGPVRSTRAWLRRVVRSAAVDWCFVVVYSARGTHAAFSGDGVKPGTTDLELVRDE